MSPTLLGLNITSKGPTSLATKIDKLASVVPAAQLRQAVIANPSLLAVPAQAFKIRYMIAENLGIVPRFLQVGFLTNQSKVWARACHLNRHHVNGNKFRSLQPATSPKSARHFGL